LLLLGLAIALLLGQALLNDSKLVTDLLGEEFFGALPVGYPFLKGVVEVRHLVLEVVTQRADRLLTLLTLHGYVVLQ